MASQAIEHPLYDTTFTLYRLSPLHFPSSAPLLSAEGVRAHAGRLGNALKGDVLRGMRVTMEERDDALTRSGTLKECRWTLITRDGAGGEELETQLHGADGFGVTDGIQVDVEYERNAYIALMLRGSTGNATVAENEVHLPLLAMRMPGPLREMFLSYLGASFDARADLMHISSLDIGNMLEEYLEVCLKHGQTTLAKVMKDVQLSLSFKAPTSPSLRSLDMMIKRADVASFTKEGQRIKTAGSQRLVASKGRAHEGPFLVAVFEYLASQLALDGNHADVSLSRIACGAFALGKEGKLKIFAPILPSEDEDDPADPMIPAGKEATAALLNALLALASNQIQDSGTATG